MSDEKITVLVVEPMKDAYTKEICGLKEMQALVGGDIQEVCPFDEPIAVVMNERGKLLDLPFNRPLFDRDGIPYDIICGTFFVTGVGGEEFVSLTDQQIQQYKEFYDNVMVLTAEKPKDEPHQKKGKHHHER